MTAKAKNGYRDLSESFTLEEAMNGVSIDDANGVLRGVAMLTGLKESLNKTYYTEKALAEAKTRYEGAKMFIDHPKDKGANRSVHDFGGVFKDVRLDGNKVRGDLHLVESKRQAVMSIAKMKPQGIGFSIKDKGYGVEKDGTFFVEGFNASASYSVDMVCEPSTNKDLFESTQQNTDAEEGGGDMDFKSLTLETLVKERPDLVESAQNAGKAAILKELEEAKAQGTKSEAVAAKLAALIEADFSKDVSEAVKKMILPDAVGIDAAKAIISGQKQLIEALAKKAGKGGKPAVTDMGQRTDDVEESAKELPTDDEFAAAFRR